MSTHAVLGVRYPDGKIEGCYEHYDGATMEVRINNYLNIKTTTCLSLLIVRAQATGGVRSFHVPQGYQSNALADTDFLDDNEPYVIDKDTWYDDHFGAHYRYMIDYETGEVNVNSRH